MRGWLQSQSQCDMTDACMVGTLLLLDQVVGGIQLSEDWVTEL